MTKPRWLALLLALTAAWPAAAQAPRIGGFTPDSGSPGTLVKIVGERLDAVDIVLFHGVEATSVRIVSPEHIKAVVPEGAMTGPIGVVDRNGLRTYAARSFVIVQPAGARPPLSLAPPRPSPTTGEISFAFSLSSGGRVRLGVFDLRGQPVRMLVDGVLPAGPHQRPWDGRDGQGHPVANGIYFVQLQAEGERIGRRLAVIR